MHKKGVVLLPGERLGYPMYHAVTGNLPVLSHALHDATSVATEWQHVSGNLPVLSRELRRTADEDDLPGWVQLVDPLTRLRFWWNTLYRSRREGRPGPRDDGRRGAGLGEAEGKILGAAFVRRNGAREACVDPSKTWQELHHREAARAWYWDRRTNATSWERPPAFAADGVPYEPAWGVRPGAASGTVRGTAAARGGLVVAAGAPCDSAPRRGDCVVGGGSTLALPSAFVCVSAYLHPRAQ